MCESRLREFALTHLNVTDNRISGHVQALPPSFYPRCKPDILLLTNSGYITQEPHLAQQLSILAGTMMEIGNIAML